MLLDVNLAEHATRWRFAGTQGFSRWLSDTPWLSEGGVCVLRLPGKNDGYRFADCVVREVHGCDAGSSNVHSEILCGADLAESLRVGLASFFGISGEASSWEIRSALSRFFAERPSVIVVTPPGTRLSGDLWQDAIAIKEEMSKSDCPSSPTFVLMDNSEQRLSGRLAFDFTRGQPVFGVLEGKDWDDVLLWNVYVHVRLAWEAGGDPSLADDMYASLYGRLPVGHDDNLEGGLNRWASEALRALAKNDAAFLSSYLCGGAEVLFPSKSDEALLERAGLIWRPWGSRSLVPTPWVARALLCEAPHHVRCWLLRSALVCVPLANEILSRCQELEQQLKASAIGTPAADGSDVPEDTYRLWERYRDGRDVTTMYPRGHPSPPDRPEDAWTFASLGQFLIAPESPLGRRYTNSELTLSRLRNTLAHGHYVSWAHVRMMKEIFQALSL